MKGWIHVICGPMYSGKTEELLRLVRRQEIAGRKPILFKPEVDTRNDDVTSRAGNSYPATVVQNSLAILVRSGSSNVFAIDEAQFLDARLPEYMTELANEGNLILISGLDRDFRGRPFGSMALLLIAADQVTKLSAVCFRCKGEATLTQRLINGKPAGRNDPLVLIGGMNDETYEARCRSCYEAPV